MVAAQPQLVSSVVLREVDALLVTLGHYVDPSDPRILAWFDTLEKAMPAGRMNAYLAMSEVLHLTGDLAAIERMQARASLHGAPDFLLNSVLLNVLVNLGYQSRALKLCREIFSIRNRNVGVGVARAMACGGFSFAGQLLQEAKLAGVDLSHVDQIDSIRKIVAAASEIELDVHDDQFAAVLDLAGDLMRGRRLFWMDLAPRIFFDDEMQAVGIRYRLDVSPEIAGEIADEFIDAVIAAGLEHVPITVGFHGVLEEQPEPIAA